MPSNQGRALSQSQHFFKIALSKPLIDDQGGTWQALCSSKVKKKTVEYLCHKSSTPPPPQMAAYHTSNPQKSKMLFASQILESRIMLDRLHVLAIFSLYFSLYTGGIHVPCLWYKANKTSDGKHVAMSKSNLIVENFNLLSTDGQRQQSLDQIFLQITVL